MRKSNLRSFDRLACVLSDIHNMGYEVILVSSGSIITNGKTPEALYEIVKGQAVGTLFAGKRG